METIAMTTKLYKAAAWGKVGALEEMMQKQPKVHIFALVFQGGKTALHISAFYGRGDFVKKLIQLNKERDEEAANEEQRGSFLRVENEEGNTALHEAVRGGDHDQIVEMLIEADSELAGIRNNKGESPLFIASAKGRLNALKKLLMLIEDSLHYVRLDGQTCLHHALLHKKDEVAKTLIEKAPELCKLADNLLGNTPLHIAATRGCPENIVQKLLQCDPRSAFTRNKIKQQTALHMAAQHGHLGVLRCILRFAEDCIEIRDENGKTALHHAVENGQFGAVKCLARCTTIIDIADKNGYTALDIAKQKHTEEPLSPYLGIRFFFRIKKTISGVEAENQTIETSKPFSTEGRYSTTINGLSICAVLIATVTFQAAFTLPPHEKDKKVLAGLFDYGVFYNFVFSDILAFCFSMAAAILLAYATFFRRHGSFVVAVSAVFLSMAFFTMMFSFSFAMFIQLRQDYHKLAASFYYSMYVIAPTSFVVVFLVLSNALGLISIVELVCRESRFLIKSAFTWCQQKIGFSVAK